jgi:hypothetical protein
VAELPVRVLVGASLSVPPFSAGTALDRVQYVLGLRALGHEAYLLEEVEEEWCLDARGQRCPYAESANRAAFEAVLERFDLREAACQLVRGSGLSSGLSRGALLRAIDGAELLLNISGHVQSDDVLARVGRRAYIDQDPVYTQLWHAAYGADVGLERHDVLFTVGQRIGAAGSRIPDCGRPWQHTLPPVLPWLWWQQPAGRGARFTTVSSWGRYGDLEYEGRSYSSKQPEFLRFAELPARSARQFELVLSGAEDEDPSLARLRAGGWRIRNRRAVAGIDEYRRFIAGSGAEIGIAKGAYVTGRAGWIGDRSCHYLASGKPVLAQSTGIESSLPVGEGLVTFSGLEEAVEAAREITLDYERHARRAMELAHEVFDFRRVLPGLLERATASRGAVEASVR